MSARLEAVPGPIASFGFAGRDVGNQMRSSTQGEPRRRPCRFSSVTLAMIGVRHAAPSAVAASIAFLISSASPGAWAQLAGLVPLRGVFVILGRPALEARSASSRNPRSRDRAAFSRIDWASTRNSAGGAPSHHGRVIAFWRARARMVRSDTALGARRRHS
jgi:hypothetical protein